MAALLPAANNLHKLQRPPLGREYGDGDGDEDIDVDNSAAAPLRYASLERVYSAASVCVSANRSSNVMSKKVKARKLVVHDDVDVDNHQIVHVYSRRPKRLRHSPPTPSFFESLIARSAELVPNVVVKTEICDLEDSMDDNSSRMPKKRRIGSSELLKLGVDSSVLGALDRPRLRDCRNNNVNSTNVISPKKKRRFVKNADKFLLLPPSTKRWIRLVITFRILSVSVT